MSNSPLISYTEISKSNRTHPRNHKIDTITVHCVVGQLSVETLGSMFANPATEASSNYGIGADGRIAIFVDEGDRSWCSSNAANDHRAITIECASEKKSPYEINDKVYSSLIDLCTDICRRNGIRELKWEADASLIGQPDKQNMTVHRWFARKSCPGDYIYSRLGQIASEVNERLRGNEGEEMRYNKISEMPEYSKLTIKKMIDNGFLSGTGLVKDEDGRPGDLDLSTDMIRVFVINDRAKLYDK